MSALGMGALISIYIFLFAHLTKDKDFTKKEKDIAFIVFGLIGVVYVLTRIIF